MGLSHYCKWEDPLYNIFMKDKIIVRIEFVKLLAIFTGLLGASVSWLVSSAVVLKFAAILMIGLTTLLISLSVIVIVKIYNILKLLKEFK